MDPWETGLAELRSDEHIKRRAAAAMELTPAERLAEAIELAATAATLFEALPEDVRARALAYQPALGPGAEEALRRLLIG